MATRKPLFRPEVEALTPYQPGRPIEDVQRELGLERVVKLASNEGPFPPFPAALEAMERAERDLNRYPDGGIYRLHEALAARHGVAFEEVCAGSGADGCIDMLSQAVLGPGDEIVCGWPSFPSYVIYAAQAGRRRRRRVPLRDHRYDLDALAGGDRPADEARLRLPPEQPDRDDEHAATSSTPSSSGCPDDVLVVDRPGVLRVHRPRRLPRRGRGYFRAGRRVRRAADVLEDLRPRRPARRLRGRPGGRLRGDGEGAPAVRRHDDRAGRRAREPRRPRRARAPARCSTRRASPSSPRSSRATGSRRLPARSATSSTSTSARTRRRSSSACSAQGVIVRPLAGFGAPNAIRVSVGTPEEHELPRRGARPRSR